MLPAPAPVAAAATDLRLIRGTAAAVAAAWVTGAAHALGGGQLPDVPTLAVAALVVTGAGVWLSRRRRGPLAYGATLAAAQWIVHGWFSAAGAHCAPAGVATGHAALHGAGGTMAVHCHPAAAHAMGTAASPGAGCAMVAAHACAVLVCAGLLVLGERGAAGLIRALVPPLVLPRAATAVLPCAAPSRLRVAVIDAAGVLDAVCGGVSRRGPPARRSPIPGASAALACLA